MEGASVEMGFSLFCQALTACWFDASRGEWWWEGGGQGGVAGCACKIMIIGGKKEKKLLVGTAQCRRASLGIRVQKPV